jgi:hypothetical protein
MHKYAKYAKTCQICKIRFHIFNRVPLKWISMLSSIKYNIDMQMHELTSPGNYSIYIKVIKCD